MLSLCLLGNEEWAAREEEEEEEQEDEEEWKPELPEVRD